jgi:ammonium transporter, Amt family
VEPLLQDPVTGLPNRTLLAERVQQALAARSLRPDRRFALLLVDVDRMKTVNDSFGHRTGDRLLQLLSERLLRCVRSGDTVARVGGDDFALLVENVPDEHEPVRIATRIREELETPYDLGDSEVFLSASVGIALATPEHVNPDDLLRDAETALDRAKRSGRGRYAVFEPGMQLDARTQLRLETDLRRAVERNEIQVLFQPIVSLATGRVIAAEALAEWRHPTRGPLPPDEFIPAAEETGLIVAIGDWVLREACREAAAWSRADVAVSVNVSARQLLRPELVDDVRRALSESGLAPERLRLEVTESLVMEDPVGANRLLQQLKNEKIKLLLDDFGTGYSSLAYLDWFPFDSLKIDRSFLAGLHGSERKVAIVRAIVSLAQALGMKTVAEGVETLEQLARLVELRCDAAQGFWFAPPIPAPTLVALLERGRGWTLPPAVSGS